MIAEREARRADGARRRRPGQLVILRAGDLPTPLPGVAPETELVCLNAVRQGKGFLNHYLVPLDPLPGRREDLSLLYVDYNLPLREAGDTWTLELVPVDTADAAIGQVVENASGRFLKTSEAYKDAFSLAYVDIVTGQVRRRQDRGQTAVYDWRLERRATTSETMPAPVAAAPDPDAAAPARTPADAAALALRPLEDTDVEAVAALLAACGLGTEGEVALRLRPVVGSPLLLARVAEVAGEVVGVAIAVHDGTHAWLTQVAVAPDRRRRGLGGALVEAIATAARRLELRGLHGTVDLAAGGFASATGFQASPRGAIDRPLD